MLKKLALVAVMTLGTSTTFAAGYGDAGCGLGSMVFGNSKGFVQVFAATTNGTSGSQTFGITSGTSNCKGGGKTVTAFIDANKPALKNDIAKGHGETLTSLVELYNCESSEAFSASLKTNYSDIFSSNETATIKRKIEALSVACGA